MPPDQTISYLKRRALGGAVVGSADNLSKFNRGRNWLVNVDDSSARSDFGGSQSVRPVPGFLLTCTVSFSNHR